jgi:hypothetical protein
MVLDTSNSHYGIASKSNDCKFDLFLVLCIMIIFDHFLVKSAMIAVKNNKVIYLRQSRRLENVNRSKRVCYVPPDIPHPCYPESAYK